MKWITAILTLFYLGSVPVFAQSPGDELKFHFVIPSSRYHPKVDRDGPLKIEFRNVPFQKMAETLKRCHDEGILPLFNDRPPVLYVYLPSKKVLKEQKERLTTLANEQFEQAFPGVTPQIKFRITNSNFLDLAQFSSNLRKMIEAFGHRFRDDPALQDYTQAMLKANDEAAQEAATESTGLNAPTVRKIKYGFASSRFVALAVMRSVQSWKAFHSGPGPIAAGLALILSDPTIEFFTVAYTRKIQKFFSLSPIPSANGFISARLAQFMNMTTWNLFSFGVFRPLSMQMLSHLSDPDIRAPTLADGTSLLGLNSIGALLFTGFTCGAECLRQKGWLSGAQIDLILQVSGIFDLATGLFSSNPSWHSYRFFTWGPQWTFFALVALIGKLAPVRMHKLVAVESSIKNWDDVHDEQVADASWHVVNQEDFQRVLTLAKESRPLSMVSTLNCNEILSNIKNYTRDFLLR